jgi:hypothetical protein
MPVHEGARSIALPATGFGSGGFGYSKPNHQAPIYVTSFAP